MYINIYIYIYIYIYICIYSQKNPDFFDKNSFSILIFLSFMNTFICLLVLSHRACICVHYFFDIVKNLNLK